MSTGNRARWVAETFYGDDWDENRDEQGRPLANPAFIDPLRWSSPLVRLDSEFGEGFAGHAER